MRELCHRAKQEMGSRRRWRINCHCSDSTRKASLMFLPQNMTDEEKTLAAEVARGILAKERPATPTEEAQARSWAEQVAAEMIWAARSPDPMDNPDAQQRPEDPELLEAELDDEWEREHRNKQSDRMYQEAIDRGAIKDGDPYLPAEDVIFGRVEIEVPPRPR